MTNVTGAEFDTDLLKILNKAAVLSISSENEVLSGSQGYKFIAFGTDFGDFDAKGFAHSGTVTQFEVVRGDSTFGPRSSRPKNSFGWPGTGASEEPKEPPGSCTPSKLPTEGRSVL